MDCSICVRTSLENIDATDHGRVGWGLYRIIIKSNKFNSIQFWKFAVINLCNDAFNLAMNCYLFFAVCLENQLLSLLNIIDSSMSKDMAMMSLLKRE